MKGSRKSLSLKTSKDLLKSFDTEKNLRAFSESISLELSVLIGTILGELDFSLTEKNIEKSARDTATWNAVSAAERALLCTRNLKYFSRLHQNPPQIFDLSQLILDSVELSEPELNHLKIRPKVLVEANLFFEGDPGCIEQIVLNLMELVKKNLPENSDFEITLRHKETIQLHLKFNLQNPLRDDSLILLLVRSLAENMGAEVTALENDGEFNLEFHFPKGATQKQLQDFRETRRYRRIRLTLPAKLTFSRFESPIPSQITLLSVGGCFAILELGCDFIPEAGENVTIHIDYFKNCSIQISNARIANLCWVGEQTGVGIEFQEMHSHAQKIVRALVKSHT